MTSSPWNTVERIPSSMRAVEVPRPGGIDALQLTMRPTPQPEPYQVLVEVAAAGVNFPDVLQRRGLYTPPPGASDLPGLEIAGRIVAVGDGVPTVFMEQEVCALVAGGGYAEFCAVPMEQLLHVPPQLTMVEAAAVPETFFTVWANVFDIGKLKAGETFLVHGGSSGIGTAAIQLARAFGARVFATAGSAEKCHACLTLGAARAFNYREQDFVEAVKAETSGAGVDLVLDMVGGDYLGRNLAALAMDGRIVQIAYQRGHMANVDIAMLMRKRALITGSLLRPRSIVEKGLIAKSIRDHVWPLVEQGKVRPVIHATFPLKDVAEAHRLMESGTHIGKIVLTMTDRPDWPRVPRS